MDNDEVRWAVGWIGPSLTGLVGVVGSYAVAQSNKSAQLQLPPPHLPISLAQPPARVPLAIRSHSNMFNTQSSRPQL